MCSEDNKEYAAVASGLEAEDSLRKIWSQVNMSMVYSKGMELPATIKVDKKASPGEKTLEKVVRVKVKRKWNLRNLQEQTETTMIRVSKMAATYKAGSLTAQGA